MTVPLSPGASGPSAAAQPSTTPAAPPAAPPATPPATPAATPAATAPPPTPYKVVIGDKEEVFGSKGECKFLKVYYYLSYFIMIYYIFDNHKPDHVLNSIK